MTDTPRENDRVRLSFEGTYKLDNGIPSLEHDDGTRVYVTDWGTFEVLERAAGPAQDPVGTVRKTTDGRIAVKTVHLYFPWQFIMEPSGSNLNGCGDEGSSLVGSTVITAVMGTPADTTGSSEYEYYQDHGKLTWRIKNDVVEYYSESQDEWDSSVHTANYIRNRHTRIDGDPFAPQTEDTPKRTPRVFRVGDPEPQYPYRPVVRGRNGERIEYGQFGTYHNTVSWWRTDTDHNTYAEWKWWLRECGPLTEILDGQEQPELTQWDATTPEPDRSKRYTDSNDFQWHFRNNGWQYITDPYDDEYSYPVSWEDLKTDPGADFPWRLVD